VPASAAAAMIPLTVHLLGENLCLQRGLDCEGETGSDEGGRSYLLSQLLLAISPTVHLLGEAALTLARTLSRHISAHLTNTA
jgi:hypothetical protein